MDRLYLVMCFFTHMLISFVASATIHVIGDSHASFCFRSGPNLQKSETSTVNVPCFPYKSETLRILWLGPITMHRIGRDGLDFLNLKELGVADKDTVVFVFGEIDVRCHIGKQRDSHKRKLTEIISKLVSNYIKTIKSNQSLFTELTCVICSVVPPIDGIHRQNLDFPFYGSLSDRIAITKLLNNSLKNGAEKNGIIFLDIYDLYQDEDGALNPFFADETVHISSKFNRMIKHRLFELLY